MPEPVLNMRLTAEEAKIKQQAKIAAVTSGKTLKQFVFESITEKLNREKEEES